MKTIPIEVLRKAVSYSEDGFFIWNVKDGTDRETKRFNTRHAGKKCLGVLDRYGYLMLQINGVGLKYHRAVFAFHKGFFPETVDHINHIRCDNRIDNLRAATRSEQQWNKAKPPRGVCNQRGVWKAFIRINGKRTYLGSFKDVELAESAYKAAAEARLQLL